MTEINAFDTARRRARDPRTRTLLLLQAAAWPALLRTAIERQSGAVEEDGGLFAERPGPPTAPDGSALLRTATQDHHLKYAAAAIEESARAPAAHRAAVSTAGFDYLTSEDSDTTARYERGVEVLDRIGS